MTQPQQPSVEELKECREAFEQDYVTGTAGFGIYNNPKGGFTKDIAWHFYQAAWNRRTSPSPAEVSSEVSEALRKAKDCINIVWVSHHANRCDDALEAIERALNQRLSVKENK